MDTLPSLSADRAALQRMAYNATRPHHDAFALATSLPLPNGVSGRDMNDIVRAHASYNRACFVEHFLGESEEKSWQGMLRVWGS